MNLRRTVSTASRDRSPIDNYQPASSGSVVPSTSRNNIETNRDIPVISNSRAPIRRERSLLDCVNSVPASCWQTSTGWDRRVLGNSCSVSIRCSSISRRLLRELEQLEHNAPKGCCAKPKGDDLFEWVAVIEGPEDTVYRGGIFFIELHIPDDYPFHPPTVVFLTQIYHCNISRGMVCADILRHGWTPSMTISTILQAIVSLLYVCNPADPLVPTIAEQYLNDRVKFEKMARLWTLRYAS